MRGSLLGLMIVVMSVSAVGCAKPIAGAPGSKGDKGDVGNTGSKGDQGNAGPAGADGTSIVAIPFCPGYAPVYPSVFPEVGLCINDSLFAVYSANGGFLALIPPGRYSSAGIGSACDFTVGPHCTIN